MLLRLLNFLANMLKDVFNFVKKLTKDYAKIFACLALGAYTNYKLSFLGLEDVISSHLINSEIEFAVTCMEYLFIIIGIISAFPPAYAGYVYSTQDEIVSSNNQRSIICLSFILSTILGFVSAVFQSVLGGQIISSFTEEKTTGFGLYVKSSFFISAFSATIVSAFFTIALTALHNLIEKIESFSIERSTFSFVNVGSFFSQNSINSPPITPTYPSEEQLNREEILTLV